MPENELDNHPASARAGRITSPTPTLTSFEMAFVNRREQPEEFAPWSVATGPLGVEEVASAHGGVRRNVMRHAALQAGALRKERK